MQHNQLLLLAVPAISAAGSTDNGSICSTCRRIPGRMLRMQVFQNEVM